MTLVNLTPHDVVMMGGPGDQPYVTIRSSGVARVTAVHTADLPVFHAGHEIPVSRLSFGDVIDLPDPRPGTRYIVSSIAASAARAHGRQTDDLLVPSDLVRDQDGAVIGCRVLARV